MTTPQEVEASVGHPRTRWQELQQRVQAEGVQQFSQVQPEWLSLMWAMDAFRITGVLPPGMEKDFRTVDAFYRSKGNLFAELVALLLQNQTAQAIGARTKVQGFSQTHQIDVAWPKREEDALICAETKVTGAPPYASYPARGAFSDFSNRRKELKFAAADLKLFRRQQATRIEHWDVWRVSASPKTYFLWAARLSVGGERRQDDSIAKMVSEAQALINTYLDGAGIFAWRARTDDGDGYEPVPLPTSARVTDLDDVLYRIASEINSSVDATTGEPPAAEVPERRAVPPDDLPEE